MEFSFHNPTGIEFGKGKIKEIANLIPKDKKVLVVYGGGSVIDGSKYLAAASLYDGDGWDFLDGIANFKKHFLQQLY
ncbi:hypothetical protein [Halarcobacter sp.]|uniref:hypothetical protein n=1 Tax=Halarcobacter sp. TaxID=2321133 RepID=UPI002AAC29C0|nr:hypothetical protein [Halarcobacter sp.]